MAGRKMYRKKPSIKRKRASKSKWGNPRGFAPASNNFAKLTTGATATDITTNTPYRTKWNLADYPRALAVSKMYQLYRITAVRLKWKPLWNQYNAAGGIGTTDIPELYWIKDRTGDNSTTLSLDNLKQLGAKPSMFTKIKTVNISPNTKVVQTSGTSTSSSKMQSNKAWLSTSNTTVNYYGIIFYLDTGTNTTQPGALFDYELVFEFDKPFITMAGLAEGGQTVIETNVING